MQANPRWFGGSWSAKAARGSWHPRVLGKLLIIKKHEAVGCWSELVRRWDLKGDQSGWQVRVNR